MRKTTPQEKRLLNHFLMNDPIMFRDRYIGIATGKYYKTRLYQIAPALVDDLVCLGGRSVGKSYDLEFSITQTALNHPNDESLLTAFRKTHIKDRLENVISYFHNVPYFKLFYKGSGRTAKASVSRTPIYQISLRNGHTIVGISIGDDPNAVMIQGHHPQWRYGEEFQFYPAPAWVKWQSTVDPKGTVDRYYGTVDGRIGSPFRKLDTTIDKFKGKRFHLQRLLEPHFDQDTKRILIESLGGETSNEYLQQCLARWGEPIWGVWDEAAIQRNLDKKENTLYPGLPENNIKVINISAKDYKDLTAVQALHDLPSLPESDCEVILGIDAGYTQPTVILPFFRYNNKWQLHTRVMLINKVISDDQAEIIDAVADFYNATLIGIDCTSAEGRAPATTLTNLKNTKYTGKNYGERVVMVNFNTKFTIGYKADGDEIEEKMKGATTITLYKMFERESFNLYNDEDLLVEFNQESKKKSASGEIVIATPDTIHIPDAFRCFAGAYLEKYGQVERPKKKRRYEWTYPSHEDIGIDLFGRR